MNRLRRALRSRPGEEGFTMIEFMVATGVMLVAITSMIWTTLAGFRGIASARRRQVANGLANQAVEQVRALNWDVLKKGLDNTDLSSTTDPNIDKSGAPAVYKYQGEQIPHGDNTTAPPLVQHTQPMTKGNVTYTVRSYLTYYTNNLTSNTFRFTVVVTWPPLQGGTGSVQVQTILYSPTGCQSTATHPYAAPCQPFLYASVAAPAGQLNMSSSDPNVPLDYGALWLPSQSSGMQIEQIQAVQGTAATSGLALKLKGASEQGLGRQQVTSGSDNDPGQPKPDYQTATAGAQASGSLFTTWNNNNNKLTGSMAAGDTASTTSTVTANTASHPCPLLVPTSSFDLAQNDSQPCGSSKGTQGGILTGVLSVVAGPNTINTTLGSADASTTPSGSFTNRDTAPETTVCKLTSGDGCIEAQQYRALGTVILIQPPIGAGTLLPVADLPGYDSTKGLVRLTGYADSVTAEAGVGAAAPAVSISGTIDYYNGSGYNTMTPGVTPTNIPVGTGGNGVHITDPTIAPLLSIDVTGTLTTGGASVSDPAAGCTSPCTRTSASASVNSPLIGSLTYTVTYAGNVVAQITTAVDLGTLTAQTSYTAAPSGA